MFAIGASELLLLLVLGGGIGAPIGLPPGPEDPLLASAAPETCLLYSSWTAPATPSLESGNQTEQLLAEPQVRQLMLELQSRLSREVRRAAAREADPRAKALADLVPQLASAFMSHSGAVYVTKLAPAPGGPPDLEAAVVLNAGDKAGELKTAIDRFQKAMSDGAAPETVRIEGEAFSRLRPGEGGPALTWGRKGNYVIAAVGDGVVESLMKRLKGPAPKWLETIKASSGVERRSTVTYLNLALLQEEVVPHLFGIPPGGPAGPGGPPDARRILAAFGLDNLTALTSVNGLDEKGFVSVSRLAWNKEPKGLLTIAQAKPLTAEDLAPIPHNAPLATALRLDAAKVYDLVLEAIGEVEPAAVERIEGGLSEMQIALGYKLRDDILASLGDSWRLYADPNSGGLLTGWTVVVDLRDAMRAKEIHERFVELAQRELSDGPEGGGIRRLTFNDREIHYFNVPEMGFPFTPSWCIDGDQMVLALFPQTIKAFLSRSKDFRSLADSPEVAELLKAESGPLMIGRQDAREMFELAYPAIQMFASAVLSQARKEGIDLDVAMLPSASAISPHLTPGLVVWRPTESGWEMVRHQSVPGGGIGASAPLAAAFVLPAVGAAREAARRAQGANNLKQIALAVHNYADTFGALPAAYSVDKDGKPLLSWRVHILPYIEQEALYRRFKLDEPWDSEHNKALIPLMPAVLRDPNSRAEPGKSNYLAITGKAGIFVAPADAADATKFPKGVRFADITDGTSNTLLTVAAGDERAVIWTKPDDFNPDEAMSPVRELMGLNRGGFHAGMADGSVRFIAETIDPAMLEALFTRNGGEVVGGF